MSFAAPQNTLRYHSSRPLSVERDMRGVPLQLFTQHARKQFSGFGGMNCMGDDPMAPEEAALIFYSLQHAVSEIRDQFGLDAPLPENYLKIVEEYHAQCNPIAIRLAYYVWAICVGEARHKHWDSSKREKFENALTTDLGASRAQVVAQYFYEVCGNGLSYVFKGNAPAGVTCGEFSRALVRVFMHGGWGSAYGGPKWKVIAQTFDDMLTGKMSAQIFIDRAMNLAHNTAPIFNKGKLFKKQTGDIKYILDVQHASMVPNLLLHPSKFSKHFTSRVVEVNNLIQDSLGDVFNTPVDWFAVAATSKGGVSYSGLKNEQTATGQVSTHAMKAEQAAIKASIEKQKNTYKIDHQASVPKIKREDL